MLDYKKLMAQEVSSSEYLSTFKTCLTRSFFLLLDGGLMMSDYFAMQLKPHLSTEHSPTLLQRSDFPSLLDLMFRIVQKVI